MFKMTMLLAVVALPAALFAAPIEKKLPLKMEEMATRFQRHSPKHVKVSAQNDTLVISVAAVEHRGGFDETHAIDLKSLAGRNMTFIFDIKVDKSGNGGGDSIHSAGKITLGGSTQHILANVEGWQTYTFKGVKVPGNGLLKMRITIKNINGEIRIRNPRIKGDFPKVHKKKNKDRKK